MPEVLGDSGGHLYVTLAALRVYAEHTGADWEEARRELTELLLEAKRVGDRTDPEEWRYRSRPRKIDLHALVSREGRLAVVVHLRARRY